MAKAGKPQTLLLWISLCMLDLIFVDSRCYVQWIGDEMCCGHKWGRWGCLNLFPIEIITGCQFKLRHVGRSWEILFEYKLWWMQMILANACNCPHPLLLHSNGKMASAWDRSELLRGAELFFNYGTWHNCMPSVFFHGFWTEHPDLCFHSSVCIHFWYYRNHQFPPGKWLRVKCPRNKEYDNTI